MGGLEISLDHLETFRVVEGEGGMGGDPHKGQSKSLYESQYMSRQLIDITCYAMNVPHMAPVYNRTFI